MNLTRIAWIAVALIALLVVVVAGGGAWNAQREREADRQRAYDARVADRSNRIAACVRGLTDRAEGIQRDQDIAHGFDTAARRSRSQEQPRFAGIYEGIAGRARTRERSARSRMLGADPDPARIALTARPACEAENPPPAPPVP